MKKVISLFLSAMMILTSVLCVNFSAFAKDYDEGKISLGKNSAKVSNYESTEDMLKYWYSFTPSETGYYNFTSDCARNENDEYFDPIIYCFENKFDESDFKSNDDGDDMNFSLTLMLEAGKTYYFRFCDVGNSIGDDLRITYTVEKIDCNVSIKLANKPVLIEGVDGYYSVDRENKEYFNYYVSEIFEVGTSITITINGVETVYTYRAILNDEGNMYYDFYDDEDNAIASEYEIDTYYPQYEKHLKAGENVEYPIYVGKFLTSVLVDIKPNPVSSFEYLGTVTVSDKNLTDDEDGYKYYYFNDSVFYDGVKIKVNYADGTSDIYTGKNVLQDEDWYDFVFTNDSGEEMRDGIYPYTDGSNQSADKPWTVGGNNIVYLRLAGCSIEVPVTVISSTPVPNPTPNPTPAPSPAPAQPAPAPSISTSAPAAQTTTQPTAPKNNKKVKVASAKAGKKSIKVTWKKVKGIKGYQIQYSTNKKFKKGNKTITVKSTKSTSATIKKLKSKKKYYVRMRTYKVVKGKKVYSAWSKAKSVKVK